MPRESTLQAITKTLILISKRDYDETRQLSDASDDSDEWRASWAAFHPRSDGMTNSRQFCAIVCSFTAV